jgi:hypothetical protein
VKWYSSLKRYGFVELSDVSGDAFLHASALADIGTRTPAAGRYARGAGRSWAAVEFFPDWAVDHTAKGRYKVVRGELNSPQYRIKHEVDGHERVVGESELGPR